MLHSKWTSSLDMLPYPMIGFSDSQIIAQIVSTCANGFSNCDPIYQTPLFFQRFLYIPLFVPTKLHGNVPVIWGFHRVIGDSRFRHTKSRGDPHGWGSMPGISKACCNTTSSTSKWRRAECYTEPWRSGGAAEAVVGAVWKGECDQQKMGLEIKLKMELFIKMGD